MPTESRTPPQPAVAQGERGSLTTRLVLDAGVVLVRVVVVVTAALGLFLLVFLGYITVPVAAPVVLALGYGLVALWRRQRRGAPSRRAP